LLDVVLFCLFDSALFGVTWFFVWYGMAWFGVCFGLVWRGPSPLATDFEERGVCVDRGASFDARRVWSGLLCYGFVWFCLVRFGLVWSG
jgi:hypothetical protein